MTGTELRKKPSLFWISRRSHLFPFWKANLLLFGLLIAIVLSYFFWQSKQAHETFLGHAREHSGMVAGVIELNARGAVLSQEIIAEIMETFLSNTARFVDYLDTIEPFSEDELTAFALEAGLSGIRIIRKNNENTEGPPGWFKAARTDCPADTSPLQHLKADHLYFLIHPRTQTPGCIIVGLTAAHIEKLYEQVSLPYMLDTLSGLAGIQYVRIENSVPGSEQSDTPEVILADSSEKKVVQTRIPFRNSTLVVALGAENFFLRIRQLWHEFFVFSAILAFIGVFFSWLLYRYQAAYLNRIRDIERELARQREDAALGRAAASITHEIRNPLNAISMGLQRLQIEADDLPDEYQQLVAAMLKAVHRTNSIVTNIRRYAGTIEPQKQSVRPDSVIRHILSLYAQKCEKHSVEVRCDIRYNEMIVADSDMIEQVIENLVKNGIEAQPDGGRLDIVLDRQGSEIIIAVENSGFELSAGEAERILEPYFTTKTRGTGLGLTIVRKIVEIHGGRLKAEVPKAGLLRIIVYLPVGL